MPRQLGAIQIFGDGAVRGGFAGQDEITSGGLNGRGNRLTSEQIVAEKYRPKMTERGAIPGEPALDRVALAMLLRRAVLRHNELWRQGQDMLLPRRHNAGAEEGMEMVGAAVGALARRAPRAMAFARAVAFRAIQRDQCPPTEAPERSEHLRHLGRLDEQPIEGRRWGAIQHLADGVVVGDGGHAEQGPAVRASSPLRQGTLMGQERRTAHEEERGRGQADVRHRVGADGQRPLATVGETGTNRAQIGNAVLKSIHTAPESWFADRRKAVVAKTAPSDKQSRASWRLRLTHEDMDHQSERDSVALRIADSRRSRWHELGV
jgi:hypothetical protein